MMYQRYSPTPTPCQSSGQMQKPKSPPVPKQSQPPKTPEKKKPKPSKKNPILGMIPPALYHPETKKVLGIFSAEDLLLAGLIFLLLENEELEDPMILYALIYILISDYIDLPF